MSSRIFAASPRIQLLSSQYTNSDSLSANSGTQTFATGYTIPANLLASGVTLRLTLGLTITSSAASVPNTNYALTIGGTTVYSQTAGAAAASLSAMGFGLVFLITGTAAPGASVAVDTAFLGTHPWPNAASTFAKSGNNTAQPVNLATNGTLAIAVTYQTSSSQAGNSSALRQMIVEQIGP